MNPVEGRGGAAQVAIWHTLGLLLALATFAICTRVSADEIQDFERARSAYRQQDYEEARDLFEDLVGGETPKVQSRPLVLESRKYLGASYLFLGEPEKADAQFEIVLRIDNTYNLDPLAFPSEVIRAFEKTRERVQRLLEEAAKARAEEQEKLRRAEMERLMKRQQRRARIQELAHTEYIETHNSRWVAAIPFGIGQFQNGDDTLGVVFLLSEGLLAATSITTYFLHESLRNETPSAEERQRAIDLRDGFRTANWLSTGLLAVVAIAGVIDAQTRFVSVIREERKRELDPELQEELELHLSLSPTGVSLQF